MIELTHRCARIYSFRFNPKILTHRGLTYCEDRKSRKHDNPLLAQYNSTWLCEGCPGPIPDCSEEEWQKLKFTGAVKSTGHIKRAMKEKKPRTSKLKVVKTCSKCGGPMQVRCNSDRDRLDLGWCFKCFEKIREKLRSRDRKSRKRIITGEDGNPVVIMPFKRR